jgi:hypothetical protein
MDQEQEDVVVGRTLRQRKEAEQAFHLLEDEAADVSGKMIDLASDLRNDPEKITKDRVKAFDTLLQLATAFAESKTVFQKADEKAAKWLPSGTPRPVFSDLSE